MKFLNNNIRIIVESKKFLYSSFLIALVVRLIWLITFHPAITSDAEWYLSKAIDLANGMGYTSYGHPTAFYPVGYPAFLAGTFSFFGNPILSGRIANILLQFIALFIFYRLASKLTSQKFAVHLSVFLLALYPNHIAYTNLLFNENLFLPLFLLQVCLLFMLSQQKSSFPLKMIVITGVVTAAATYVKPQAVLIPFFVLPVLYFFHKKKLASLIQHLLLILFCSLVLTLPWQIRNYKAFHHITFITTVKGFDLLIGNNPYTTGNYHLEESYWKNIPVDNNEAVYDKHTQSLALSFIKDHPVKTLKIIPEKIFYFFWPGMEGVSWNMASIEPDKKEFLHHFRFWFNGAFVLFVLLFFVSLIYLFFQKSSRQLAWLTFMLFACFLLLAVVFFGESRFHFHLIPMMILCISVFIERIIFSDTKAGLIHK